MNELKLIQHFEPGTVYQYSIDKMIIAPDDPEMDGIVYHTNVHLVTEKSERLRCHWRYMGTNIEGVPEDQMDPLARQTLNFNTGMELIFDMDADGALTDLVNFDSCVAFQRRQISVLMDYQQRITGNQNRDAMEEIMLRSMEPVFASPERFLGSYCPELQLIMGLSGQTIFLDSITFRDDFLPNPFGGPDIPSMAEIEAGKFNGDTVAIRVRRTIDGESMKRILQETYGRNGKYSGDQLSNEGIPEMLIEMDIFYLYLTSKQRIIAIGMDKVVRTELYGETKEQGESWRILLSGN